MLFFPYRVDMELHRHPILTLAICLLCITIFFNQLNSHAQHQRSLTIFCETGVDRQTLAVLKQLMAGQSGAPCQTVYQSIRASGQPEAMIAVMVEEASALQLFSSEQANRRYMIDRLTAGYAAFEQAVPNDLTQQLQFNPSQLQIERMITAVFSHGDWVHLVYNLIFFYAFAASVEIIIGSFGFLLVLVCMAIATGFSYSYSVAGTANEMIPTIGLSGIVMGMMALLAVLTPRIKIRCFLWVLFLVRVFSLPALLLMLWYVGWDTYSLVTQEQGGINFVAHVSGAACGLLFGLAYWLLRPQYVLDINRQIH